MKKFARKWNGMVVDQPQQNKDFPILYRNKQCRFLDLPNIQRKHKR
jgi:hypothetical protein